MTHVQATTEKAFINAGGKITLVGDAHNENTIPDPRGFLCVLTWTKRAIPAPDRLLGDLLTTTARVFLVGRTGLGKTLLAYAIGMGIATGQGFLDWRSERPARVLIVDGEMPGELIQRRAIDDLRRAGVSPASGRLMIYSRDMEDEFLKKFPAIGAMPPLNSESGHDWLCRLIDVLGGVDVVIFDNVMSLLSGVQKEEEPWKGVEPLVQKLTEKRIAQLWLDHTGHNTDRQYGTSTKAWRFDAVGIMTELPEDQRAPYEVAFQLSFEPPGKARRRTPDNWPDFATRIIRLKDDCWTSESADRSTNKRSARKLRGDVHTGFRVLTDLVATEGEALPAGTAFPSGVVGVTEDAWRHGFYRRLTDRAQDAKQKAFRRMVTDLQSAGLVALCDGWAWLTRT